MKKSYLYITLFFGLILSCGGSDKDEIIEPENTAPTVPSIVYPLNNTLCVNNEVKFEWNSSIDAEGNRITYKIEVSENSSFSPLAYSETSFIDSKTISLTKGKAYYWRIKAVDSQYAESGYSSVSHFLTEGEGISNHIPFAPSLLAPALDSEIAGTSTTLSWSASDVDNDPLTFDVYLDTSAQPTTKVSENKSGTTFDVTGLSPASTYYFKVVVKDDKGGTSIGQVWSFATK